MTSGYMGAPYGPHTHVGAQTPASTRSGGAGAANAGEWVCGEGGGLGVGMDCGEEGPGTEAWPCRRGWGTQGGGGPAAAVAAEARPAKGKARRATGTAVFASLQVLGVKGEGE